MRPSSFMRLTAHAGGRRLPGSLVLLIGLVFASPARADDSFAALFDAGATLRVDFLRTGGHDSESVGLDALIREGPWAGPRTGLVKYGDTGEHRVVMELAGPNDAEANADANAEAEVVFALGFSSLFAEWQSTPEARGGMRRAFHETVRVPFPRRPVTLRLESRDGQGDFKTKALIPVDPAGRHIRPPKLTWGSIPSIEVQVVAPSDQALDVLIVGDGYTEADLPKYRRDVARFARALLESAPMRERRDLINVRALEVTSNDRGPTEPRKGLWRFTALSTTFDTFGLARYLTTVDNLAMRDIAGTAPYDTVLIMVNTSRYGGAGVYNLYGIFPSDNEFDEYVLLHEFGHGFAGLGDEYFSSEVTYEGFYTEGVEPWEPNLTALLDPDDVKWGDLIADDTPCPTPPDPERYGGDTVGCFEGAGYQAEGLFRPALDCKMFGKGQTAFCPVCARAIGQLIDHHAGR